MKKFLIIVVWLYCGLYVVCAQTKPYPLKENLNISVGGGINFYNNDTYDLFPNIGYGGDVTISKWVSNCVGVSAMCHVMKSQSAKLVPIPINRVDIDDNLYVNGYYIDKYQLSCFTLDASLMFDLFHSMKNKYNPVKPRGYILFGFGGIIGFDSRGGRDFDLLSYLGYHHDFLSIRFSNMVIGSIFIEPRIMLLQPNFDNNNYFSTFLQASFGFNFKINPVLRFPMYRPIDMTHASQFWQEDWFVGFSGGITSFNYKGIDDAKRASLFTQTFQLTLGKYNSPCFSTRLHVDVGTLAFEDPQSLRGNSSLVYCYPHADVMFNISKWCRYKFSNSSEICANVIYNNVHDMIFWERFHVEPFVGMGMFCRHSSWSYALDAGVRFRAIIAQHFDLFIESLFTQLMARSVNDIEALQGQSSRSLHYTSLMFGINYNIGKHGFNY